jgi:dihydroorotate dehydrogenase
MDYGRFRRLLFRLDPETSHHLALSALHVARKTGLTGLFLPRLPSAPRTVMGIRFKNPVGLAAGFDKNGDYINGLFGLGFGFVEVGTITPRPQPGNPKPRLFRIPQASALINRMGFNNHGVDYLVGRLEGKSFPGPVGVNIGKNASTPLELAHADYLTCFRKVYPHADYVAINVSSPNTPDLRRLQDPGKLAHLLSLLKTSQASLAEIFQKYVPLAVKLSPDLADNSIDEICDILKFFRIDAVIATNTTTGRIGVEEMPFGKEPGGLSGAPVRQAAIHVLRRLVFRMGGDIPIIAAGGIMSAGDATARFQSGAQMVQLYTGLIYEGPGLIGDILEAIP